MDRKRSGLVVLLVAGGAALFLWKRGSAPPAAVPAVTSPTVALPPTVGSGSGYPMYPVVPPTSAASATNGGGPGFLYGIPGGPRQVYYPGQALPGAG